MQEPEIAVTVLTGFLGSGKTTLLKQILSTEHGQRIAVIENEFGQESVDHEILVEQTESRIIEMNNGCICCTVRGDLIDTLKELHAKRQQGDLAFDRVVIETTGLADPGPVAQSFFMDEEVSSAYLLDAVITLIDARHGMDQLDREQQARAQIGFADRILITKTDLVSESDLQALKARLVGMNGRAAQHVVVQGQIELAKIFDLRGFNLNAVLDIEPQFLAQCEHSDDADHVHGPDCDHHHHHHQDDVQTFLYKTDRKFEPAKLEEFLSTVVQVYGVDLLRYKGVLNMNGFDRRVLFQGVHMLMGTDIGRAWQDDELRESKMVFIGRNLPRQAIENGLTHCLV